MSVGRYDDVESSYDFPPKNGTAQWGHVRQVAGVRIVLETCYVSSSHYRARLAGKYGEWFFSCLRILIAVLLSSDGISSVNPVLRPAARFHAA